MKRRSPKINLSLKYILLTTLILFEATLLPGCALFSKKSNAADSSSTPVSPTAESVSNSTAKAAPLSSGRVELNSDPTLVRATNDSNADLIFGRSDLEAFDQIEIKMVYADVQVSTVPNRKGKRGSVHVHLVRGDATRCKVKVVENNKTQLKITDSDAEPSGSLSAVNKTQKSWVPSDSDCHYFLELTEPDPAELSIETQRGSVLVENWDAPVTVKMEWGDIDVGNVGSLSVQCMHCMLSGEGIAGKLEYTMDSGNVGVAGLAGPVNGVTLGDTVLKWQKMKTNSAVQLVSRAGDVLLSFPGGIPLAMNVKAPKGDVYTNDMDRNSGIPVSVTAELGNIRLYRNGKP